MLEEEEFLSVVVCAMAGKSDGENAAKSMAQRNRRILYNAMEFAVRSRALDANPLKGVTTLPSVRMSGVVEAVIAEPVPDRCPARRDRSTSARWRPETDTRPVPAHPKLVVSLREHIAVQRLKPVRAVVRSP
ncbi:hypothetical protein ACFRCG_05450 [Embleya sp. NPDC056575]|uniref:hypothetical protein n=1 Tax=unclassified Embleya TaxID=2699296 RepID=UPI00369F084E